MNREEQDELWGALGVVARHAQNGLAGALPGMSAVVEVLCDQVADALLEENRLRKQRQQVSVEYDAEGNPRTILTTSPPGFAPGGALSSDHRTVGITIGEPPANDDDYRARLAWAKRRRGIGS